MQRHEPTEDEKKQGWTKASLNKYLKEREMAQFNDLYEDIKMPTPTVLQNNRYNPHKWRL